MNEVNEDDVYEKAYQDCLERIKELSKEFLTDAEIRAQFADAIYYGFTNFLEENSDIVKDILSECFDKYFFENEVKFERKKNFKR